MQDATSTLDTSWHYEQNGERKGAVSQQQLIALIQQGQLTYGSRVWKKGMADWMQIEQTELRQHLELSLIHI